MSDTTRAFRLTPTQEDRVGRALLEAEQVIKLFVDGGEDANVAANAICQLHGVWEIFREAAQKDDEGGMRHLIP